MATTTKMKMVMKGGKKVPAFAADMVVGCVTLLIHSVESLSLPL